MLKNISWTDYTLTVLVTLAIYYLFVGLRYYSQEIKDVFTERRKFKPGLSTARSKYNQGLKHFRKEAAGFENIADAEFAEAEYLIERLKTVIEDASRRKLISQEFKQYITSILKEYPSVKNSAIRPYVNELILSECQKYEAVTLNEDEVDLLWREKV